jgi:TonB family protein
MKLAPRLSLRPSLCAPRLSETGERFFARSVLAPLLANFLFFYCLWLYPGHGKVRLESPKAWHPTCLSLAGVFLSLKGEVSMRLSRFKRVAAAAGALVILSCVSLAQSGSTDESKRKVKTKVSPVYPELARRMNVAGKVKIEVVVNPDGHVKTTRVVGGHPLLVQACQDAVKEWKFVPASEETTQVVEFEFRAAD